MSDRKVSDSNQQTYQRLKAALSLSLRRQIFLAACDDLTLRNRLAMQLQTELTSGENDEMANARSSYPGIVTLNLNGSDPNPIDRIAQWLDRHPPPRNREDRRSIPIFQIVGVEHLTRQPSIIQRRFLSNLQKIARSLLSPSFLSGKDTQPNSLILESSLLLWMPKPWLLSIQQSAVDFWDCHTGIFEFSGEPTPVLEENINEWDWVKNYSEGSDRPSANFSPITLQQTESRSAPRPSAAKLELLDIEDRPSNGKTGDRREEIAAAPAGSQVAVASLVEKPTKKQQPKTEVDTYRTLGNFYRDRLERGEATTKNVTGAIAAYEKALEYLDENAPVWSDLLNDIGNLYWMLSRETRSRERSRSYLEQGIKAYEIAIAKTDVAAHPSSYLRLQKNLGAAYGEFARYQQPVANLQQSIAAYQEALRYYSRQERQDSQVSDFDPLQYASTQNNLGTAYWNLAQHQQSATNLKRAIAAYREALPHYNPEPGETDLENPSPQALNYGMIQNNLGTAYWNLARYEQPQDYLQLAIWAYRSALNYRTATAAPAASAATQNNLGTAYWHLANREGISSHKRVESLLLCIAAYERAIEIASNLNGVNRNLAIPLNFDLFATHNNLAIAHYQLATGTEVTVESKSEFDPFPTPKGDRASHLEASLEHHLQALQGWQQQPELYQNALSYVIQTIRAFYRECGLPGQNLALSKVPGTLLPEILQRL